MKKTYPLYYAGKKQRFARSVVVGDLIFLSGSSGRTLETGEVSSLDVREQTRVAFDKIRLALEEAGTTMEYIVKTVVYLKDMAHYEAFREEETEYYKRYAPSLLEERPASTVVQVVSLAKPDMLVEVDVIATFPPKRKRRAK